MTTTTGYTRFTLDNFDRYGIRCRVCGVATQTLRSDWLHDAKETREETVVFEDAQTIS